MADPIDGIPGVRKHRITELTLTIDDDPVVNLDTAGAEYLEFKNKGSKSAYFRTDGTTPTSGEAGNGDELESKERLFIPLGNISDVKFICASGESTTVFCRLYT